MPERGEEEKEGSLQAEEKMKWEISLSLAKVKASPERERNPVSHSIVERERGRDEKEQYLT